MPRSPYLPRPRLLSNAGRVLAGLQLLKETLTIVLLGVPLLRERPLLVLVTLPGLVLYLFRWAIVLGQARRRTAAIVWVLTLIDEAWGLALYLHAVDEPTARQLHYLAWSYGLGLGLTLSALSELAFLRVRERAGLRALLRSA